MKFQMIFAVMLISFSSFAANAQTSSIATSAPGGAVHNLGLLIAETTAQAGLDLRVTPFTTTTQAIPVVAAGQVDFGLANAYELQMANSGTVAFDGRQVKNLRTVAALYPFKLSLMVRADSDVSTVVDLAGKRIPAGFGATATGEFLIAGMLAASGLAYDDVEKVTVSGFGDMQKAFEAGRIDAMIAIVGSGRDVQIDRTVGRIRVLNIPADEAAQIRMREHVPVARAEPVAKTEGLVGIDEDISTLAYDYYLYTSAAVSDETVRTVLQGLIDGQKTIASSIPAFRWFDVSKADEDIGLDFHPAATIFYGK